MFELLQAIGGILNIRWAHNGIVTTGHYCTAQGLIEQIGDLGVAFITLVCLLSRCLCVWDSLIYTLPVSRRPHFRSGCVGSWLEGAWRCRCRWPCLLRLRFHYALGGHRCGHSQEL